jgi:ArsR family transcriptional regulator, lead/cadmium/zinc/bismuth-responsive transcriptional repressor
MKGYSYMSDLPDEKTLDKMEDLLNIASDYTRLKILYVISSADKNVNEIVKEVGASQSLVSHQLKILRKANLVDTRKEGTKVFYRLADDHVIQLLQVVYEHVVEK